MSSDDTPDDGADEPTDDHEADADARDVRKRLEQEADRAVEQFDEGIVDLLSWVLDTETRARIYVHLRQHEASTSEEIAEGTGLYPSTVREALAELHDEGKVRRSKRENSGAGNNPYEYRAIPPSDLVSDVVGDVQRELNTVFNLDRHLGGRDEVDGEESEPVTINVEEETDAEDAGADDAGTAGDGDDAADGEEGDHLGDDVDPDDEDDLFDE